MYFYFWDDSGSRARPVILFGAGLVGCDFPFFLTPPKASFWTYVARLGQTGG